MKPPTPWAIRAAREKADLSQTEAGELIDRSLRQWQRFESGEHPMHIAYWQMFKRELKKQEESQT